MTRGELGQLAISLCSCFLLFSLSFWSFIFALSFCPLLLLSILCSSCVPPVFFRFRQCPAFLVCFGFVLYVLLSVPLDVVLSLSPLTSIWRHFTTTSKCHALFSGLCYGFQHRQTPTASSCLRWGSHPKGVFLAGVQNFLALREEMQGWGVEEDRLARLSAVRGSVGRDMNGERSH